MLIRLKISLGVVVAVMLGGSASAALPQSGQRVRDASGYQGGRFEGQFPGRRGQLGRNRGGVGPNGRQQARLNNQQMIRQRILREIGLRPEQLRRMQQIRRDHEDEVISIGRRVRQARRALDDAVMSEQLNDAEINRRIDDLAQARYDQVKLQQRIRVEVRRVLTPEQVMRFKQIQRQIQQEQRERRQMELEQQDRGGQRPPGEAHMFDPVDLLISPPPPPPPPPGQAGTGPGR